MFRQASPAMSTYGKFQQRPKHRICELSWCSPVCSNGVNRPTLGNVFVSFCIQTHPPKKQLFERIYEAPGFNGSAPNRTSVINNIPLYCGCCVNKFPQTFLPSGHGTWDGCQSTGCSFWNWHRRLLGRASLSRAVAVKLV